MQREISNEDFIEGLLADPFLEEDYGSSKVKLELETQTSIIAVATKEDILSRSIFVKNVDYTATTQILEEHFKECGPIVRSTIKLGPGGQPLGYAYIEFGTMEAAMRSKQKNESLLLGR